MHTTLAPEALKLVIPSCGIFKQQKTGTNFLQVMEVTRSSSYRLQKEDDPEIPNSWNIGQL
jgi:hypothetical protein